MNVLRITGFLRIALAGVSAGSERYFRASLRGRLAVPGVAAVHRGRGGRHDQRKCKLGGLLACSVSFPSAHGRVGGWVPILLDIGATILTNLR